MAAYYPQRKTEKHVVELEKIVDAPKPRTCPNVGCGKMFEKVLILTDPAEKSRTTYHACPHCFFKVEIAVKKEEPQLKCPYYFEFLKTLPKNFALPDYCLTCPKMIECRRAKISWP